MGEVVDLRDDLVEPVDLLDDDLIEVVSKIGVIKAIRQELREGLDRNQRIANFVRHARGEVGPESRAIEQILFLPRLFLRGHIVDDGDRAQRLAVGP